MEGRKYVHGTLRHQGHFLVTKIVTTEASHLTRDIENLLRDSAVFPQAAFRGRLIFIELAEKLELYSFCWLISVPWWHCKRQRQQAALSFVMNLEDRFIMVF